MIGSQPNAPIEAVGLNSSLLAALKFIALREHFLTLVSILKPYNGICTT